MKLHLYVAIAACLVGQASAAILLPNGSFEAPYIGATNTWQSYNAGSTAIPGWTVIGGPIFLTPDTVVGANPSEGRQFIDLTGATGYDKGLKSDTVLTTIGQTYRLSFDVGNWVPHGIATLGMSINGGSEQLFTNTSLAVTSHNPMNWMRFSYDWVADTTGMQVSFLGRPNGGLSNDQSIGLDNVTFEQVSTPVPEPQSWALVFLGLLGLGTLTRRRKVQ